MRNVRGWVLIGILIGRGAARNYIVSCWVSYDPGWRFVMRKKLPNVLAASLLAGCIVLAVVAPVVAQSKQSEGGSVSMPKVGDVAPDFTLKYFDGNDLKEVSLSQYRGKKNVVLGFFIFAFTGG
jgi:hypothetical protein